MCTFPISLPKCPHCNISQRKSTIKNTTLTIPVNKIMLITFTCLTFLLPPSPGTATEKKVA